MARLDGKAGAYLVVEPLRYAFDQLVPSVRQHDGYSVVYEDFSGNLLKVRVAVSNGRQEAETTQASLLTWELHRLVDWMRALPDGAPLLAPSWSTLDGDLELEAEEVEGQLHLRACLGVWPETSDPPLPPIEPDGLHHLDFTPSEEDLRRFADALAAEMEPFPIRVVEANGEATWWLQWLDRVRSALHLKFQRDTVLSADGTPIATWRTGTGPALVLVTSRRQGGAALVPVLAEHFTVVLMERRGQHKGMSGPYRPDHAIEREFEDVVAVVDAVREPVVLMGERIGALCCLEATRRTTGIRRLILIAPLPAATRAELKHIEGIEAKIGPIPTVATEIRSRVGYHFNPDAFASVSVPTLILVGSDMEPDIQRHAETIAAALPDAVVVRLPGPRHAVAWDQIADQVLQEAIMFASR